MDSLQVKQRNSAIDIFRLVCAIMVVAIHTHPFEELNEKLSFVATQIFPRIGVPFFFCIAGFYFTRKLLAGKPVKKQVFDLLSIYLFWSLVYFLKDFLFALYNKDFSIFSIRKIFLAFFILGSSYHFWYFPALFFCMFLAIVFNKFHSLRFLGISTIPLYIIGLLGCSYKTVGDRIPVINLLINSQHFTLIRRVILMGLPFFMLGYFVDQYINHREQRTENRDCVSFLFH